MKGKKTESRRKMRRMIDGYRDTIARLVDVNNEQQKEISELRELLGSMQIELKEMIAYAKKMQDGARIMQSYIRCYREEYGVMLPEETTQDDGFIGR